MNQVENQNLLQNQIDFIFDKRFCEFAFSSLSKRISIQLEDGNNASGIFYTAHPDSGDIILKDYKLNEENNCETKILSADEIAYFTVEIDEPLPRIDEVKGNKNKGKNVRNKEKMKIDGEISKEKNIKAKDLVKWEIEEIKHTKSELVLDEKAHQMDSWDQFQANKKLFDIDFNYHDDFYTTKLDQSKIDENKKKRAEMLEKEILNADYQKGGNHILEERGLIEQQDVDEEGTYAAVLGSGRYEIEKPISNEKEIHFNKGPLKFTKNKKEENDKKQNLDKKEEDDKKNEHHKKKNSKNEERKKNDKKNETKKEDNKHENSKKNEEKEKNKKEQKEQLKIYSEKKEETEQKKNTNFSKSEKSKEKTKEKSKEKPKEKSKEKDEKEKSKENLSKTTELEDLSKNHGKGQTKKLKLHQAICFVPANASSSNNDKIDKKEKNENKNDEMNKNDRNEKQDKNEQKEKNNKNDKNEEIEKQKAPQLQKKIPDAFSAKFKPKIINNNEPKKDFLKTAVENSLKNQSDSQGNEDGNWEKVHIEQPHPSVSNNQLKLNATEFKPNSTSLPFFPTNVSAPSPIQQPVYSPPIYSSNYAVNYSYGYVQPPIPYGYPPVYEYPYMAPPMPNMPINTQSNNFIKPENPKTNYR